MLAYGDNLDELLKIVHRKALASETCSAHTGWEHCRVRIFENQETGEYRILTLRGKNVDQRQSIIIFLKKRRFVEILLILAHSKNLTN
jgi:hypothetical protein